MGVKVTGQFEPAGDFAIVDGKDVSGNITGSAISASGAITVGSIGNTHRMTGSLSLSGSLHVHGQTVMDSLDTGSYGLVVSGAMSLANQYVGDMVQSASVVVSGLGTVGHRDLVPVIDLGEGFTN